MKKVQPVITGAYLNAETQKEALLASLEMPLTPEIEKDLVVEDSNITDKS